MRKVLLCFLLLFACSSKDEDVFNGYIEGEYVYISSYTNGILDNINVKKGDYIKTGDSLFSVDSKIWQANVKQAQHELEKAQANYANLCKGKRKYELEIIMKQKAQAVAILRDAKKEYERTQALSKTKILSESKYDTARANYESAKAKVEEYEAAIQAAMLPAREDELKMAQYNIEILKQNLFKIQQQAQHNIVKSVVTGRVDDVYFRLGEYVQVGNPVVAILPAENVKVRFFVPERAVTKIKPNMPVLVEYDGCSKPVPASISFISAKSEFTPPVIYSTESRSKLIFMIEAVFDDKAQNLPPGLPVSVRIRTHE